MMRSMFLALSLAALTAVPVGAQTFRAENRVNVTPVENGAFQISSGDGYGARGMWCAAADYAQDVLGATGTSRVYIIDPRTSTSGPVTFSLNANGIAGQNVFSVGASLRQAGANLSVDHARQFCHDARVFNLR